LRVEVGVGRTVGGEGGTGLPLRHVAKKAKGRPATAVVLLQADPVGDGDLRHVENLGQLDVLQSDRVVEPEEEEVIEAEGVGDPLGEPVKQIGRAHV